MIIFASLSLLASLTSLFIGTFILAKNPTDKKNKSFFYLCMVSGFIAFFEFKFRTAESYETALYWYKASTIWPFSLSLLLYFIKNFIHFKKTLYSKFLCPLMHLSAFLIFLLDFSTDLISSPPKL